MVVGLAAIGIAAYAIGSRYYDSSDLLKRLRREKMPLTLVKRCARIRKTVYQMWKTSPSIVHQDESYKIINHFGIDFAISISTGS